ncbi:creatininase family protein [Paenibacillus koleovorans]|uniref:creatininase family protein n=1 Tax=Paenibacillus koleovorans TaxID=121608 RepID=UPI000FDB3EA3|nr:creatininase family protein [Paenibacillus koleovorans]
MVPSANRPGSLLLHELTRTEIGEWAPQATVILPVAATEQHGPHLPVMVDTLIAETIASTAAELAGASVPMLVAPTVAYGASHHHLIYPGAMSLSTATLIDVLRDLTDSLVSSGFRRIFLLNSHGGNEECIRLAARELALRAPVNAGASSYWTVAWERIVQEGRAAELGIVPGHAGGFETSLMLAMRPDLVRTDLLPLPRSGHRAVPADPKDPSAGPLIQRHGSWAAIDGYSDDAGAASAERGRLLLDLISRSVADELVKFHQLALID